ncbi:Hypothetical predicted protein [Mytilus galloprovincialis]|uniref:Uncharacterized protein n=1 Tax=Mytilus galloprovincialis TaxID=29158 RepID=A0A8B6HKR9_MYTGA|nr:Hypothetical predicted protein [Mytilus galloprovincialis]
MNLQQRSRPVSFGIYENNTERHDDDGKMPDKSYQSLVRVKSQNEDNTHDVIQHEEQLQESQGLINCKSACALFSCRNNGQCVEVVGGYKCFCSSEYTGLTCKTLINPCSRSPCKNNGVCTENGYDYQSVCPKEVSASDCRLTPCDNFPCKNQGRCENIGSGRNCNCKEGYTGKDCEKTPCSGSPCKNGGFCLIWGSIYHCTYPLGTSGINCKNISCGFPEYRQNVLKQKRCNISPCLKYWRFNIATFSCYWTDTRKANWGSANEICQSKGSSLAFIQTLEEIKWLEQFISEDIWVGGRVVNNKYRWHSTEYNYTIDIRSPLWARNEPRIFFNNYCVQLWETTEGFFLDDTACYCAQRFICKTTNLPGI